MARQLRQWIIEPGGVRGGSNKSQLFNCSLVRDELTGEYMFFGPLPEHPPEARVSSPVEFPFQFPKFTSALNGSVPRDWYITVDHVHSVREGGEAHGHWSNAYPSGDDGDDVSDSDTWTTQAGVGPTLDEGQKQKERGKRVAASASSK